MMLLFPLFLFPRATSQMDTLARPFGDCREGQKPRRSRRCKFVAPLLAAFFSGDDPVRGC